MRQFFRIGLNRPPGLPRAEGRRARRTQSIARLIVVKVLSHPDKDALRVMLESQVQEKRHHAPDAVTTYATKPEPERKPYTSMSTAQDKAFIKELNQVRADTEAGELHKPV